MRSVESATYRSLLHNINGTGERLADLRLQAATGKRLNSASDDPVAIRPVLGARSQIQTSERFIRSADTALDKLSSFDTHLESVENILVRAKEITVAAGNGSLNANDRATMADQVASLKEELLGVANAQVAGRYLFGGFADTSAPFAANPAYDPVLDPRPVLYSGDQGVKQLEIGPGEQAPVNVPGSTLFLGDADGDGAVDAGGTDIFAVLTRVEEALRANDPAAVNAEMDNLEAGAEQARRYRGQMGNTAVRVENARSLMEETQLDMQEILSRLEDADLIETISDMTRQEQALEAALNVTSRVSKISILDYL
ncbi:flagellar hook-associated protein 3 [Desulfuromonas versatilis]|uniref:Flagellar hook-associated protein 3 n=1 Tax=Desulfuromonas versatilis TaxID=2802975 RepID=A0ABM8HXB8_9BACT|nr:flagellar hook-associated protein FlgL [Desulfuromonas versatilis]BCR06604.1 flagellar hook-associated protein 3 [Desulfuromonas versatilis]